MRRSASRLLPAALLWAVLAVSAYAAPPAPGGLQKDLAYYRRLARRKSLNANDRLYVLHRIRHKYAETGVEMAPLEAEIERWEKARRDGTPPSLPRPPAALRPKPNPSAAPSAAPAPAAPEPARTVPADAPDSAPPRLTGIRTETEGDSFRIIMELSKPVTPRAVRVEDPARMDGPLLWIDLPATEDALPPQQKTLLWEEGPVAAVLSRKSKDEIRVQIELRGDPPYRVVKRNAQVLVEVKPPAPEPDAPRAGP